MAINSKNVKIRSQSGFTLLELLVVIAVIGVLASMAVPRFQNQIKKAKFVEVVNAAGPYKVAVDLCLQRGNDITKCDAGSTFQNGMPPAITTPSQSGVVQSVSVVDGKIAVTGGDVVDGKTYVLDPAVTLDTAGSAGINWTQSGTCLDNSLCEPSTASTAAAPAATPGK